MRLFTFKTALALGVGLTALGGWTASAFADDAPPAPVPAIPAVPAGPGPATQPPAAPGTTQPAPTQPATPAAAAAPPNYKLQYNGLIDGYYLYNVKNPKNVSYGGGEPYYDTRHNSPALSLAELNVFANAAPKKFGYKATFMTGDTADINHLVPLVGSTSVNDTGEGRYKNVQQLYCTYSFSADGAGIDFGKFYTPFGYEVTESNGNYNYSRSTAYNILPFYHAGARIYTPLPGLAALTATLYLVNGIYNTQTMGVKNDSKRLGYIGQLNYTDPKGKFTLISELGLGSQKFTSSDVNETKILLNDNNFTYNINANQLIGLDYEYAKNTPNGSPKTTTNGYAIYYRQALSTKNAVALRFSGYDAKTDGSSTSSQSDVRPYDITATYEIKAAPNFLTRFEYRHDHNNSNSFFGGSDDFVSGPTKKDQDTLSLSGVFTFAQ